MKFREFNFNCTDQMATNNMITMKEKERTSRSHSKMFLKGLKKATRGTYEDSQPAFETRLALAVCWNKRLQWYPLKVMGSIKCTFVLRTVTVYWLHE